MTLTPLQIAPTGMRLHEWTALERGYFQANGIEPIIRWDIVSGIMSNQPGDYQSPGGHEHLFGGIGGDVRLHRRDPRVVNRDVAPTTQPLTGIQDIAALDQEVILLPGRGLDHADWRGWRRLRRHLRARGRLRVGSQSHRRGTRG